MRLCVYACACPRTSQQVDESESPSDEERSAALLCYRSTPFIRCSGRRAPLALLALEPAPKSTAAPRPWDHRATQRVPRAFVPSINQVHAALQVIVIPSTQLVVGLSSSSPEPKPPPPPTMRNLEPIATAASHQCDASARSPGRRPFWRKQPGKGVAFSKPKRERGPPILRVGESRAGARLAHHARLDCSTSHRCKRGLTS